MRPGPRPQGQRRWLLRRRPRCRLVGGSPSRPWSPAPCPRQRSRRRIAGRSPDAARRKRKGKGKRKRLFEFRVSETWERRESAIGLKLCPVICNLKILDRDGGYVNLGLRS